MVTMNRQEQMKRAVNDMKMRFPELRGKIENDFFSSRFDRPKEDELKSYDIPLIVDKLFSGGRYRISEIAGVEVEDDVMSNVWYSLRGRPLIIGYGARTFFKLKSKKGVIHGRMRVTFCYIGGISIIPITQDSQKLFEDSSQQVDNDNFTREIDYLRLKHLDEAAVYQIDSSTVEKIKPEEEMISELADERDTSFLGAYEQYKSYKELGFEVRYVNRLPGQQQVIDYFKKIWMLESEF